MTGKVFLKYVLRGGIARSKDLDIFSFIREFPLFPTVVAPRYISTQKGMAFLLLYYHTNTGYYQIKIYYCYYILADLEDL